MTSPTHATQHPLWKRVFTYIRAYKDFSQLSAAERQAIRLGQRLSDMREKVQCIELNFYQETMAGQQAFSG